MKLIPTRSKSFIRWDVTQMIPGWQCHVTWAPVSLVISGPPLADFSVSLHYIRFSRLTATIMPQQRNASQFVCSSQWVRSHHCRFFVEDVTFFSSFVQLITCYYHVTYIAKILCLLSFFKRFSLCYSIVLHSDADFLCIFCIIFPVSRCNFSADFLLRLYFCIS